MSAPNPSSDPIGSIIYFLLSILAGYMYIIGTGTWIITALFLSFMIPLYLILKYKRG
jgi:hypothetical protein